MPNPENPFDVAEQEARDQDDDTESLYAASIVAPRTTSAPTTATTTNNSRDTTATLTQSAPPPSPAPPPPANLTPQPPTSRSPSPPPLPARPSSTPSFTPSPHWSNPATTTTPNPVRYSIHAATNPPAAPHLVTEFYSSSEPPAAQPHNPITGSLTGPGPASNQHYAYLRSHLDTLGYAATPAAPRRTYTSPPGAGGSQAGPSGGGRKGRKGWFRRGKDRSASGDGGGAEGTRREGAMVGHEAVEDSGGEDEEDEFERYQREVWAAKRGLVLDGGQAGVGVSSRAGQQGRVKNPGRGTLRGEAGGWGGGSNYANKLAALELEDEVEEYRLEVARARYPEVNSEQKGKRWFGLRKGKGKQRDEVAERVAATQVRTEARNVRWG
ncbi:hypothetical protein B9Z65_2316 [Elsinoe australis]|uniref:Uncharacterized protein n=1 Tax=Elsinoe australis TaxID=40998 RepID=A0A2P7ZAC1_9PEZI|nr:hypothetical protein B9Z65_2316 [Elsinoe australis]